MPNFKKTEAELESRLDKWLYFIKHLEDFQTIPTIFKDEVFAQAFAKAELAKFNQAELDKYEASLKVFRDNKAVFDYARESAFNEGKIAGKIAGEIAGKIAGKIEGEIAGKIEVAKKMKLKGLSLKDITELTGLSESEVDKL